MLQIEALTKMFGDFTAVRDLSFDVAGGEIVGLLGPNGAGKTTTIRCVTSILKPTQGRIRVNGPRHRHGNGGSEARLGLCAGDAQPL